MKKNLMLLSLIGLVSLAACSTMPVPSPFANPAPPQPSDSWVTPATPPRPPLVVIGGTPNVTGDVPEQSWLEVTTYQAERPASDESCTATASKLTTGQVSVVSVGCAGASSATVRVIEASGRDTPQLIGPQNLVITQRGQGVPIAAPTFRVLLEGRQSGRTEYAKAPPFAFAGAGRGFFGWLGLR